MTMTSKQHIWVTFQKEGLHKWPDATQHPGIEFLANEHRHMFHFRVDLEVWHDDREVEFILFKRELAGLYEQGTLQLDYKAKSKVYIIYNPVVFDIFNTLLLKVDYLNYLLYKLVNNH